MKCRYCHCEMEVIGEKIGETMQILGREWRCACGVLVRETWQPYKKPSDEASAVQSAKEGSAQ